METVAPPVSVATLDAFRRLGYLYADLDPLDRLEPEPEALLGEADPAAAGQARRWYCGPIGVEFMHIEDPERQRWVQEKMERDTEEPARFDRSHILDLLIRGETFEQMIQARYLGTKRFSIEGVESLLPLLDEMLESACERQAQQVVLAMSHRGRLNVMVHTVGVKTADVFAGFEDVDPRSILGGGDVKYHMGATGDFTGRCGHTVNIHLVSNPSHLEAVDPVAVGRVRAKQTRLGDRRREQVIPIVLHGDAAFAGQGILAETLNCAGLPGYDAGGTIHVVVNNLIGFTTEPKNLHASRFSTAVARRLPVPIFHVNGEEPDAVARVARLAVEYRHTFKTDVIVDLIGYRRHGHSEVDDPTITQPLLYKKIAAHPPIWKIYARATGVSDEEAARRVAAIRQELEAAHQEAGQIDKRSTLRTLPPYWDPYVGGAHKPEYEVSTGVSAEKTAELTRSLTSWPEGFHIHDKIKKLLEQRAEMGQGKRPLDYGMAEALAFASLLSQGIPVRMTGQDCRRGTFNQRHSVLIDVENGQEHVPLAHVAPDGGWIELYDSFLSEAAVLGFEYGFSRDYPEALVLWEAQFGDFANGAQIIIDQFVTAGEDKWGLLSGVTLLLPHGYEGQGPEHSSARMERYLQLCGEDNIQVCQPSNAGQYFHLLRRQAMRRWRKPLVVMTPKSMLRHKDSASTVADLARGHFLNVVPDGQIQDAKRLILCTGKIGHELKREREKRKDADTAVAFLDQLYPFPEAELGAVLEGYPNLRDILWVQEEPANMGALFFVQPRIERLAGRPVRTLKRSASGSPATGSAKAHALEQQTLLTLAFTIGG
jgi:2-oxoglutarate dehydrogenase E1 component